MRFTAATVALFAGLASAAVQAGQDSTVYETEEVTITSCGPTVTNCPASSGAASTTPAVATTTPAGGASWSPAPSSVAPVSSAPAWSSSSPAPAPPAVSSSAPAPAPPAQSVTVVAHTTCVPTVVYSTIPLPSGTSPVTGGSPPSGPAPAGSSSSWVPMPR